jgi:isocitrate dehydrogenase (NAD+)
MAHRITLIEGDGIGPEVIDSTIKVLGAVGFNAHWDRREIGLKAIQSEGVTLPKSTLDSIKENGVALKGPTTTPIGGGHQSANVGLRKELDLYACIRPVRSIAGIGDRYNDVDIVVVRENTEGLYVGQEFEVQPGCVVSLRTVTEKCSNRITQKAFEFAEKNRRSQLTLVHKANILKKADGLFLRCAQKVAEGFPNMSFNDALIDALCMRLVLNPCQFDVLVLENMFGDIVSDLCAGLVGGLGLVPGANIGDRYAVFEAVHGSAPDIAGADKANPSATIQSAIMMLRHLGEVEKAMRIESALIATLQEKELRTRDLGGKLGTKDFTKVLIERL